MRYLQIRLYNVTLSLISVVVIPGWAVSRQEGFRRDQISMDSPLPDCNVIKQASHEDQQIPHNTHSMHPFYSNSRSAELQAALISKKIVS